MDVGKSYRNNKERVMLRRQKKTMPYCYKAKLLYLCFLIVTKS